MIIYILINESMPDVIKIGKTDNLERRIKELDNTSTPLPFQCYYAVEIEDQTVADKIEKRLHRGLDKNRTRQKREFFNVLPESAKDLLKIVEDLGGKDVTPKDDIFETKEDKVALDNAKKIRSAFNFTMINMQPGTTLEFSKDSTITCEVIDNKKVKFREKEMSLTKAALIIINEMGYDWDRIAGPSYWTYKGETLADIRRKNEI